MEQHTGALLCSVCGEKQGQVVYVKSRPYCSACAPPPPVTELPSREQLERRLRELFGRCIDRESSE